MDAALDTGAWLDGDRSVFRPVIGDQEPVTIRFAGTLTDHCPRLLDSLGVALPGQRHFHLDLSRVVHAVPGALEKLAEAVRAAVSSQGWRVTLSHPPGSDLLRP